MNIVNFFFISIFLVSIKISAQNNHELKMMQYHKIEKSQKVFINKPLREFIKTLDVPISSMSYQKEDEEGLDRIILRFDSRDSYNKLRKQNIMPGRIIISFNNDNKTKEVFRNLKNHYGVIESNLLVIKEFEPLIIKGIIVSADKKLN